MSTTSTLSRTLIAPTSPPPQSPAFLPPMSQDYKNAPEPKIKIWKREETYFLMRNGILGDDGWELVEGQIIVQMPQKKKHKRAVSKVSAWLYATFGEDRIQTQGSIDVRPQDNATNEPEPDAILTHRSLDTIPGDNARPADIALLIEVGDSTRDFDLGTKAKLYARAGIVEYWVVNIPERAIVVHRDPTEENNGKYLSVVVFSELETLAPVAAPDAVVRVADLLPPPGMDEEGQE